MYTLDLSTKNVPLFSWNSVELTLCQKTRKIVDSITTANLILNFLKINLLVSIRNKNMCHFNS